MLDKIVSYIEKYAIKLTEWCWHTRVKILKRGERMLPEELIIVSKLPKQLKDKYQAVGESMMAGAVDNMEKYISICWDRHMPI